MSFFTRLRICGLIAGSVCSHAASAGVVDCYPEPSCSDPNHHQRPGMNNCHWPSLKELLQGPKPFPTANYNFWYDKEKLRADDHGHTWCDYAFMADAYHEDWRTTTRWDCEKSAELHQRTRDHSLAVEAAWCRKWKKCQAGYIADTSGRPLLNIPRAQSECGIPPKCWPMFGGKGLPYQPYVYRPLIAPANPALEPVCPPELARTTPKRAVRN
jgi:hypothetical protein